MPSLVTSIMIKQLLALIKAKSKLKIVNLYHGWQAKRKLAVYVKTLSPAQQAWANELQLKLKSAGKSGASKVFMAEAARIDQALHRVTERLDPLLKEANL